MKTLMHPLVIAAIIAQIGAVVIIVLNLRHTSRVSNYKAVLDNQKTILKELNGKQSAEACKLFQEAVAEKFDEKRSKSNCQEFRGRIGAESQHHFNAERKIVTALTFLVTKAGGTPADLDLG